MQLSPAPAPQSPPLPPQMPEGGYEVIMSTAQTTQCPHTPAMSSHFAPWWQPLQLSNYRHRRHHSGRHATRRWQQRRGNHTAANFNAVTYANAQPNPTQNRANKASVCQCFTKPYAPNVATNTPPTINDAGQIYPHTPPPGPAAAHKQSNKMKSLPQNLRL